MSGSIQLTLLPPSDTDCTTQAASPTMIVRALLRFVGKLPLKVMMLPAPTPPASPGVTAVLVMTGVSQLLAK
jgi:hypothetical protein